MRKNLHISQTAYLRNFSQEKGKKEKACFFFGRISPIKNLETLIKALCNLVKKYPGIKLKIIGPSEEKYKSELLSLIKSLDLEKNVKFYPAVYDLNKKIKVIDDSAIFILPSLREAMPQSLIEAMSRGKIVVASNNKGSGEIIKDNKNGFLFPVSDSEKLAEAIDFCMDKRNKKKLDKVRKAAIQKSKDFGWSKIFKDFYNLIRRYT